MTESVSSLMLEQLHESPFNPRLTFDEAYIAELADSIRQRGVLQPIVVRPMTGREFQFEIVFGHCRTRAAALASYATVPAIVRAMSDEEAALAQIHENLKRKDVHAIEEALGYVRLMSDHQVSVADLIKLTGKKPTYIYARLKLAQLGDAARGACLRGELDAETGVLVARYCRTPKQQQQALDIVISKDYETGAPVPISYRRAKALLREHFCIHIDAAPFDRNDAALKKYVGACSTCPKLAGNDPGLADEVDADICTDPECYKSKCAAHADQAVARAQKAGHRVVQGDEAKALLPSQWARQPQGHVRLNDVAFTGRAIKDGSVVSTTFAEALQSMGKTAPKPVLIVNPHKSGDILEVLPDADALKVLQHGMPGATAADQWDGYFALIGGGSSDGSTDEFGRSGSGLARSRPREIDSLPPDHQAVLDRDTWQTMCRAIFERVRSTRRSTEDLRLIVLRELHMADEFGALPEDAMGWTAELDAAGDTHAVRLAKVQAMSADDLAALLVMAAIDNGGFSGGPLAVAAERLELARRYGVPVMGASTPSTAGASAGEGGPSNGKTKPATKGKGKAKNDEQMDDDGCAVDRDPNTADLFGGARV